MPQLDFLSFFNQIFYTLFFFLIFFFLLLKYCFPIIFFVKKSCNYYFSYLQYMSTLLFTFSLKFKHLITLFQRTYLFRNIV